MWQRSAEVTSIVVCPCQLELEVHCCMSMPSGVEGEMYSINLTYERGERGTGCQVLKWCISLFATICMQLTYSNVISMAGVDKQLELSEYIISRLLTVNAGTRYIHHCWLKFTWPNLGTIVHRQGNVLKFYSSLVLFPISPSHKYQWVTKWNLCYLE